MGIRLTIESLAHGGSAISHLADGRVVFVDGACPGDIVEAQITAEHSRHAQAHVLEVVEPSPARVEPPCPYFGVCGGCQWQHVSYDAQLSAKRSIVVDALERIGGLDAQQIVATTVASPSQYGYRNKIELIAGSGARGLTLGYSRPSSHEIVEIDQCLLLPDRLRRMPKSLRGALRYISGDQDLHLRRVGLRAAVNTRDVEIAVWGAPGPFPRAFARTTLSNVAKVSSIVRVLDKGTDGARAVSDVEVLKGKGAWRERLEGHSLLVSAPSFFQVNTRAAEKLITLALHALEVDETHRVLDLYCGVGTFTLPIAQHAAEVVGVESSRFAIADLRRNAEAAEVYVDIVGGDAAREISSLGSFDRVIVDPPRTGLASSVVNDLGQTGASRIVYVSCDPATLARDVKQFSEQGWTLSSATPVDLFPQTYHVETVGVLDRSS